MLTFCMTIVWNEAEIGGRKCASIHFEQKRLYVVERFDKVVDRGVRVGVYADLREAKEAVLKIRRSSLNHKMRSAPEVMGANKAAPTSVVRL
jgi:hypothetical protein